MVLDFAIFAVSLAVLVKSADYLVEYSARLARHLRLSDLVVGLVITSVGTSLPELASSVSAALAGSSGLVIGNVVGSNIANIGLVLGVAAVVRPFATERRMHDRDGFLVVASAVLFFFLALDNRIGRIDAAIFLAVYVAYVTFVARSDREGVEHRFRNFLAYFFDFEYAAPVARRLLGWGRREDDSQYTDGEDREEADTATSRAWRPLLIEMGVVLLSLAALIVSARYVVIGAVQLAKLMSVPENLIGLSLVAVGTSLPELLVAIAAARKGKAELVVGNVMGSNIANALLIVGIGAGIRPLEVAEPSVVYTIPVMLFFSLGLLYFVRSDWSVDRRQGLVAVISYAAFLTAAFLFGWE